MKAENFGWWFRIIVKILIPISYFIIANIGKESDQIVKLDLANAIAGVMFVATLFMYILIWNKIGEKRTE